MPVPVTVPLFPNVPFIFRLPVLPAEPDIPFSARRHMTDTANKRGLDNENKVERYLKELAARRILQTFFKIDTNGNDFLIIKNSGRVQPLQVKSSDTGVKKHKAKWPQIPAVVIDGAGAWRTTILDLLKKKPNLRVFK